MDAERQEGTGTYIRDLREPESNRQFIFTNRNTDRNSKAGESAYPIAEPFIRPSKAVVEPVSPPKEAPRRTHRESRSINSRNNPREKLSKWKCELRFLISYRYQREFDNALDHNLEYNSVSRLDQM